MAILLLVSLALGAGLAWQAIRTAGRHRQTAERALEDYAGFAAFILASQSYRQLGGAVVETFTKWPAGRAAPSVPAGTACPAGITWFERDPLLEPVRRRPEFQELQGYVRARRESSLSK